MSALTLGVKAPDFTLTTTDGKQFSLTEALQQGPVVLVFFKISCPVCQYALPYFERVHRANSGNKVTIVGVSQDNQRDTLRFMKEFGVTFPVVLDPSDSYAVSNAYGLTNVPSIFWIAPEGTIEISSVGWSRRDVEDIFGRVTENAAPGKAVLFQPGEDVRDFRSG
jgi:peroxiredoxin